MPDVVRQHLIDPVSCARCNSCADVCPSSAISYKKNRYIVDPAICDACGECLDVCPSGSIDHWHMVPKDATYSLEQQLAWPALPARDPILDGDSPPEQDILFPPSAPATAHVVSVTSLNGEGAGHDIRKIVLDLGEQSFPIIEGQSIGILPPRRSPQDEEPAVRLYSVASARTGEDGRANHVALCVKRVTEDHEGNAYLGLCSNYLCDLAAGDAVKVAGPFGQHFLIPQDDAPLLWVATGTGISPARAMVERRRLTGMAAPASLMLFYGARTPADMAFHGDMMAIDGTDIAFHPAFSRDPDHPRQYVQDALRNQADAVLRLLDHPETRIFMCGMKGMEAGILDALKDVCARSATPWPEREAKMKAEHRLLIETY